MCGIFGVASPSSLPEARSLLEQLTDRLSHRGPDARGSFSDDTVFLGHRRLSVLDLAGGGQPMTACGGRYVIAYNGELYNFKELRAQLEDLGHVFTSEGDTEVALRAFAQWGASCLARFTGMFAFAIWDRKTRELFLARDRLGIKPLYYAMIGRRLIFASEMKAILAHPDFEPRANPLALSSYLSFRGALGEDSVFVGLKSLQPGHRLRFADGVTHVERYWEIPLSLPRTDHGKEHYLSRLREMLPRVVERHLASDVPVGAYLSGGVDSSLLVALMAQAKGSAIKTYSVGFDVEGYDESPHALAVSRHLGTDHQHVVLGCGEYLSMMEAAIGRRDQPLSIPHEPALFALSLEVKKSVTVCLSGEGADELFGGYGRVQRSPMDYKKLALYQRLPAPLRALIKAGLRDPDLLARLELKDELAHFFHVYHWWPFEEKWDLLSDDMRASIAGDRQLQDHCRAIFDARKDGDAYDRIFHFFEKAHLPNLLDRLDMQSMAASVEARVPFVDHELVEFVTAIPTRHKMRWKSAPDRLRGLFMKSATASERLDISKYLLRRLADDHLPAHISRRKKLGFPAPLDAWFGGPLQRFAKEILLDQRTRQRGFLNMAKTEALLSNPQDLGYDSYGKRVWMLVNVELWFRAHIDRAGPLPLARFAAGDVSAQG